ncbi:MAG: STAS domain-containing protein [Chloroflexi bacterium]|jgi:anti-anti-sigma factor|nr:STAS domain-containing protein [Chloroflexota bacterium]
MDFTITDYKRCSVIKGVGRIDSATAPDLEKALMDLVDERKTIVLDMSEISFVSSSGWWAIIRALKEIKKVPNGQLVLAELNDNVRDSMELIGILSYFSIYDSLVEAIASI